MHKKRGENEKQNKRYIQELCICVRVRHHKYVCVCVCCVHVNHVRHIKYVYIAEHKRWHDIEVY